MIEEKQYDVKTGDLEARLVATINNSKLIKIECVILCHGWEIEWKTEHCKNGILIWSSYPRPGTTQDWKVLAGAFKDIFVLNIRKKMDQIFSENKGAF